MKPEDFVVSLSRIQLNAVFNPYNERCPKFDLKNAPELRRKNLRDLLKAAQRVKIDSIWVARDLGYRGGRRTGIPLTDEAHLPFMSEAFGGVRLIRATLGPMVCERTARIVWREIANISNPIFLWNIFPFHPYYETNPFSNRCHTKEEREVGKDIMLGLFQMLNPERIIAIGRDSEHALKRLGVSCLSVRHPSYGGHIEFHHGIKRIYQKRR